MILFVKHSRALNSGNLAWMDVSRADETAMRDIEEAEYRVWKYIRPMNMREDKPCATAKARRLLESALSWIASATGLRRQNCF